jgi:DNA-binding response OmpR family regulator
MLFIMRIILCEDDPGIQELVNLLVSDMGYELIKCSDEAELINEVSTSTPELVIMDYWLGDIKADKIIKKLRAEYPDTSILLVSASSNLEEIYKELDVADYLKKPFDIMEFKDKISTLTNGTNNSNDR